VGEVDAGPAQGDVTRDNSLGANMHPRASVEVIQGNNGGTLKVIRSSERASEVANIRWRKRTAAALAGVDDAAILLSKEGLTLAGGQPIKDRYDVMRYLVTQNAINAADPSARNGVQSLKLVDSMAFPAPDRNSDAATVPAGGATISLSPELVASLLDEMRARRDKD
jgi:hypothetical protein